MNPVSKFPAPKIRISKNLTMQRNRRVHTFDDKHLQSPRHPRNGLATIFAAYDQFGDQRIITRRNDTLRIGGLAQLCVSVCAATNDSRFLIPGDHQTPAFQYLRRKGT